MPKSWPNSSAARRQRPDQNRVVQHDDQLRAGGRRRDERGHRRDQVRMQAGFRFVQDEQFGRSRREQRRDPQQVAEGAVGEFGGGQRPEQAVLLELEFEAAADVLDVDAGAGERVVDGLDQLVLGADLDEGPA